LCTIEESKKGYFTAGWKGDMLALKLHALFKPLQGSGQLAAYRYMELAPSPALRDFVCCYWFSQPNDEAEQAAVLCEQAVHDRVLPDGCSDIVFERNGAHGGYTIRYCGLFDHSFTIAYDKAHVYDSFGIRFFPGGAHALLGLTVTEFKNQHQPLELLWPRLAEELHSRLCGLHAVEAIVELLEQCLLGPMGAMDKEINSTVQNLLYRIFSLRGNVSVADLAESEVISSRQINRLFHQWVGASPKSFSEIARFQYVLGDLRKQDARYRTIAELAAANGYFDQAHMIREFKRFYGDSPTVALKEYAAASDLYNSLHR
jgi:AraC-like DNA-binding protein